MNSASLMSLKAKLNQQAKITGIPERAIFQIYLIDRFLERLSKSDLRKNFVIKGGVLMARLANVSTRATQDLDVTLVDMPLTEQNVRQMIQDVCDIPLNDNIEWNIVDVEEIREKDIYGGFRVKLDALCFSYANRVNIDFSTGDIITPGKQCYELQPLLSEESISLFGYSLETLLAEKIESILSLGSANSRMKDFFDVYWILENVKYDRDVFQQALQATADHRKTSGNIARASEILDDLKESPDIRSKWDRYCKKYDFAKAISIQEILEKIQEIL